MHFSNVEASFLLAIYLLIVSIFPFLVLHRGILYFCLNLISPWAFIIFTISTNSFIPSSVAVIKIFVSSLSSVWIPSSSYLISYVASFSICSKYCYHLPRTSSLFPMKLLPVSLIYVLIGWYPVHIFPRFSEMWSKSLWVPLSLCLF